MGVYTEHYWVNSIYVPEEDGIRLRRPSARQTVKTAERLCCDDTGAVELRFPLVTLLVLDYIRTIRYGSPIGRTVLGYGYFGARNDTTQVRTDSR